MFEFRERDAPKPESARQFVSTIVKTGRFVRNEKSTICFRPNPNDPSDTVYLIRWQDLAAILEDGEILEIEGDVSESCYQCLWQWLNARKHYLTLALSANAPGARR